jgi:hypothetical protein
MELLQPLAVQSSSHVQQLAAPYEVLCPLIIFSCGAAAHLGLSRLILKISRSYTIRHTHTHTQHKSDSTPLDERSARLKGCYIHNTQPIQETNIHVLSGIRTHNPSNRVAADRRLRPHERWDRLYC